MVIHVRKGRSRVDDDMVIHVRKGRPRVDDDVVIHVDPEWMTESCWRTDG